MKHPKLRSKKKKIRLIGARKTKKEMREILYDNMLDILPYMVNDLINYLAKRGYKYAKDKKKNSKKKRDKSKPRKNKSFLDRHLDAPITNRWTKKTTYWIMAMEGVFVVWWLQDLLLNWEEITAKIRLIMYKLFGG